MKFEDLLHIIGDEPIFETGHLLSGSVDADAVRRQLSRWVQTGKLYQLRRGLYAPAPPYQKTRPHPFLIANRLVRGSYVSLQTVLALGGLIPEYVPVVTSITTARPGSRSTPLGRFDYRHISLDAFFGYDLMDTGHKDQAFVATPEKALLDLIHLEPGGDRPEYIQSLRLQHLDRLNMARLKAYTQTWHKPKLYRALDHIRVLAAEEQATFEVV